jgi:hypothetical protein
MPVERSVMFSTIEVGSSGTNVLIFVSRFDAVLGAPRDRRAPPESFAPRRAPRLGERFFAGRFFVAPFFAGRFFAGRFFAGRFVEGRFFAARFFAARFFAPPPRLGRRSDVSSLRENPLFRSVAPMTGPSERSQRPTAFSRVTTGGGITARVISAVHPSQAIDGIAYSFKRTKCDASRTNYMMEFISIPGVAHP